MRQNLFYVGPIVNCRASQIKKNLFSKQCASVCGPPTLSLRPLCPWCRPTFNKFEFRASTVPIHTASAGEETNTSLFKQSYDCF